MKLKKIKESIKFSSDIFREKYSSKTPENDDEFLKKAFDVAFKLALPYLKDDFQISISSNDIIVNNLNIKKEKSFIKEIKIKGEKELYFITLKN